MTPQEAASFMKVELTITPDALKVEYRKLVKLYHPDVSTLHNALEMLTNLNNAYDVLKDIVPCKDVEIKITKPFFNKNSDIFNPGAEYAKAFGLDPDFFAQFASRMGSDNPFEEMMRDSARRNAEKNNQQRDDGFHNRNYSRQQSRPNPPPPSQNQSQYNQTPPPPPPERTNWKRSASGNLYINKNNFRIIIFSGKAGPSLNRFKIMQVFKAINGAENKVYLDNIFNSELEAQLYVERALIS